jgi:hypothetical protein
MDRRRALVKTTEPRQAWQQKADEGEKKTWERSPDEKSLQVVENGEEHEQTEKTDANFLADFLNTL